MESNTNLALFQKTVPEITDIQVKLTTLPAITDQEVADHANRILKQAKNMLSYVEAERKKLTSPLDSQKKEIMDYEKKITAGLVQAIAIVNTALTEFAKKMEAKRLADLKAIEDAKNAEIAALEIMATNGKQIEEIDVANVEMSAQLRSSFVAAPKSIQKRWKYEVKDLREVPREYLMVEDAKVKEAIKAGIFEIPGLNIYQEIINVSR